MSDTDLQGSTCSKASLLLNDFIYHNDAIYRCINKNKLIFEDIDTKKKINLNRASYWRLQVIHFIPSRWETVGENSIVYGK
jgi:hypothetical protein